MGEYDSAIALAQRLIAQKGTEVTLRTETPAAAPDPTMPWRGGANTPTDQTVDAVFLDYEQKYIDGTTIRTGDQRVFMPATDTSGAAIAPEVDSLVIRGTEVWRVVRPRPLAPGSQMVMFELQVRQ